MKNPSNRRANTPAMGAPWTPFLLILCAACSESEAPWESVDPALRTAAVIGGEPTSYEEFRSAVALVVEQGPGYTQMFCTGSLIDERVVLTAGHCVYLNDDGFTMDMSEYINYVKVAGGADINSSAIELAGVEKIVRHPTWNGTVNSGHDIAILLLDQDVTSVAFSRLRDFPQPEPGEQGMIAGYGLDENGDDSVHRKGEITLLDVLPNILQYGGGNGANGCFGDSGGPVFTKQNDEWVVSGVNSFITGASRHNSCSADQTTSATNVLAVCDWLNKTMLEVVGHDLGLDQCKSCQIEPAADWGQGCGPGLPECSQGTRCFTPPEFHGFAGNGYCAARCCELDAPDAEHCSDVAGGEESCAFADTDGQFLCAISCEANSDCPTETECRNLPFASDRYCVHYRAIEDTDSEPVSDTNADTQDTATERDAGSEPVSDTNADTNDTAIERDSSGDAGASEPKAVNGCNCEATGRRVPPLSKLLALVIRQ